MVLGTSHVSVDLFCSSCLGMKNEKILLLYGRSSSGLDILEGCNSGCLNESMRLKFQII
jgi:hypothetical protein